MADVANRSFLRLSVAKICQDVGFNSIQSTPLEVLTDLLQDYVKSLAKTAYNYAIHCGNTEPNLYHLALAFRDMGVSISELKEYVRYVDSSSVVDCAKYPTPKDSDLNLLKPGSREVVTRAFHIHSHLPPMHPHLEDQDLSIKQEPCVDNSPESTSPGSASKSKLFKRLGEPVADGGSAKRIRCMGEEEGRPLRELSSVMMTTSGFLSPAREGKLPESRTPFIKIEFPLDQETNSQPNPDQQKPKKKCKLSPEHKKIDKEIKTLEKDNIPVIKDVDVIKPKKNSLGKEGMKKSKLTSKNALSSNLPGNNNLPKIHKKMKNTMSTVASLLNPSLSITSVKVKSPKNEKNNQITLSKDASTSVGLNLVSPLEYKISSEPEQKQKLNIFKKISKVKEGTAEESDSYFTPATASLSRVDVTIESVIKREMIYLESSHEQEMEIKDEVVDIETVISPNPYVSLVSHSDDTAIPSQPVVIPVKEEKKRKKIKKISIKETIPFEEVPPIKSVVEPPIVNETVEEVVFDSTPALNILTQVNITERVVTPPLPSSILDVVIKKDVQIATPANQLPSEGVTSLTENIPTEQSVLTVPSQTIKNDGSGFGVVNKKKLHKKEKKEKVKKKKKDKLKNKEKSEKRKLKQEKKVKDKTKQKLKKDKKEKKKDKEHEESKVETTNAVPKITLKLGPASPANSADSNPRKIVILPIKKDSDVLKPDRAPSPELARFSPLVPIPKHKPSKTIVADEVKINTDVKPVNEVVESSLPPSVRLDSEGNQVWICPACGRQDDGSPMIGCDECDAWYHWVCVGIQVPPNVNNWYCSSCINKKKITESEKKKKDKKKVGKKSKEN